jgi:hypothetical protein
MTALVKTPAPATATPYPMILTACRSHITPTPRG